MAVCSILTGTSYFCFSKVRKPTFFLLLSTSWANHHKTKTNWPQAVFGGILNMNFILFLLQMPQVMQQICFGGELFKRAGD